MKILSQKREGNKVLLEIEEAESQLQESLVKTTAEASKEIKLPGFRPGKAPREMVERALDREVLEHRAAQNLIAELYPVILDEARIEPVDYPDVEIVQRAAGQPFIFKLKIDVYPEVKLGKYKGLKVEKKPTEVKEAELLEILGRLQERYAVVGPGGEKKLLPLDDEFAKKVSHFGSLAELKAEVSSAAQREKVAEVEADLKNQLIAAATSEATVALPVAMIDREIDVMLDELRTSLAQSNLSLEDYLRGAKKEEAVLRGELRRSAEIRVKGKVVLKAVAEAEKLTITPAELQAEIRNMAETMGEKVEVVAKRIDEGGKKYIEEYLLRAKALELLTEKASIKEGKS
jgi:FKBP-type peptidyl-prolyl cis-trans isomerase (trigger factor)